MEETATGPPTCAQVLDDELCYKYSEYGTVYEVFATRARMFRSVYLHKCAPAPCWVRLKK